MNSLRFLALCHVIMACSSSTTSSTAVADSSSSRNMFSTQQCKASFSTSCSNTQPCCAGFTCNVFRGFTKCLPVLDVVPSNQPTYAPFITKENLTWGVIDGASFARTTYIIWNPSTAASIDDCRSICNSLMRCDFVMYSSQTNMCTPLEFEKTQIKQSTFKCQKNGTYVAGELTFGGNIVQAAANVGSVDSCNSLCCDNALCQYSTFNKVSLSCTMFSFAVKAQSLISFRMNPLPKNYNPLVLGRFDVIGHSGIVCLHQNILPNGKVLCVGRPEMQRGLPGPVVPNTDNLSLDPARRAIVPFGEIASIFDPVTGLHVPSQINDDIFCHGSILLADARVFTSGGHHEVTGAAQGLSVGLQNQRTFDYTTNTWSVGQQMWVTRWYPTVLRATNGKVYIFGGLTNGIALQPEMSFEVWDPVSDSNAFYPQTDPSTLYGKTWITPYNPACVIPGSGNIWYYSGMKWAILDPDTGAQIENSGTDVVSGNRGSVTPMGSILLPLHGSENPEGIFMLFGGSYNWRDQKTAALPTVARLNITAPYGNKKWVVDTRDNMPYGRVLVDAVLQPNGKILLMNGGLQGWTGGDIGVPLMFGAALDVFCYDPTAPIGSRYTVFGADENQQFYHSVAALLPDGRTMKTGSDEVNYDKTNAYNHRVDAFTPPWLLNGVPRPVIVSISNNDGVIGNPNPLISSNNGTIYYGMTFEVTYTGPVSGISITTPNGGTHGLEMTQRLLFPDYYQSGQNTLTVRAPVSSSILLQGYHMLWLLNGDTPSVASWIRLMDNPK